MTEREAARRDRPRRAASARRAARTSALVVLGVLAGTVPATASLPADGPRAVPAVEPVHAVPAALTAWRSADAQEARLTAQAEAHARSVHEEAVDVARAAARSVRAAAEHVPSADLDALRARLAALTAAASSARASLSAPAPVSPRRTGAGDPTATVRRATVVPQADAPPAAPAPPAAELLAQAHELEEVAGQAFALSMHDEVVLTHQVHEAPASGPGSALADLEALVAVLPGPLREVDEKPDVQLVTHVLRADPTTDGWPNGAIPTELLCPVQFAPRSLLRCDAAQALEALNDRFRAETGGDLTITSAYRTYEEQASLRQSLGWLAAPPGRSNHGRGVAVDLGGFGSLGEFDAPAYLWMVENGPDLGWHHPPAMRPGGGGPQEPWHWEYTG